MCEAMGTEPDPEQMPPSMKELGYIGITAIDIYNKLTTNYVSTLEKVIHNGKDYTFLMDLFFLLEVPRQLQPEIYQIVFALDMLDRKNSYDSAVAASRDKPKPQDKEQVKVF